MALLVQAGVVKHVEGVAASVFCHVTLQSLEEAVLNREQALQDPSLPFLEFEDILATIGEKLPIHVSDSLYAILSAPNALPDGSQVSKHIR